MTPLVRRAGSTHLCTVFEAILASSILAVTCSSAPCSSYMVEYMDCDLFLSLRNIRNVLSLGSVLPRITMVIIHSFILTSLIYM
jgi:hypothetical protein